MAPVAPAARAETRLVEAIVYYLGVATSAGAVWGESLKSPFKYHHCCCVMLLRILKMGQIDLFVGGPPWLALASGYLEQRDCLCMGSAKFCPGGGILGTTFMPQAQEQGRSRKNIMSQMELGVTWGSQQYQIQGTSNCNRLL